jgi:multidrug transporter EmrE-like cation transporter
MGIISVVVGAVLLNLDQAKEGSVRELLKALVREKGSILMAGVALIWSLVAPLDKVAIGFSSPSFHGMVLSVGVALGALVFLVGQRKMRDLGGARFHLRLVISIMVCASIALAFQLLSIQVLFVSLVETVKRAVGCFMAIFLGRLVFRETVTIHKLAAVTVVVVGIVLIST